MPRPLTRDLRRDLAEAIIRRAVTINVALKDSLTAEEKANCADLLAQLAKMNDGLAADLSAAYRDGRDMREMLNITSMAGRVGPTVSAMFAFAPIRDEDRAAVRCLLTALALNIQTWLVNEVTLPSSRFETLIDGLAALVAERDLGRSEINSDEVWRQLMQSVTTREGYRLRLASYAEAALDTNSIARTLLLLLQDDPDRAAIEAALGAEKMFEVLDEILTVIRAAVSSAIDPAVERIWPALAAD